MRKLVVLIFLGVFWWSGFWARVGVDSNHDGISLKPALDMVWGKVLYREVFSHYGPLTNYIHAGAMYVFGEKLMVVKMVTAAAYGLTGVIIWWLGRKLTGNILAILSVVLWLGMATYYYQHFYTWASVYGALIHLLTGCWLWRVIRNNLKDRDVLILGVLAGVGFWFKQPYLLTMMVLVMIFWFGGWQQKIKYLLRGFGLVGILILLIMFASGGLWDWWKQNIWVGYINGRVLADQNTILGITKYFWDKPLWLVIAMESVWMIWKLRKYKYWPVMVLVGSSLVHFLPLLDDSHMYWAITPVVPIWVSGIKKLPRVVLLLTLFLVVKEVGLRIDLGKERLINNNAVIKSPEVLQGMMTDKNKAQSWAEIDGVIKNNSNNKLVSLSVDALYMTFSKKAQNVETMYCDLSGLTSGVYPYGLSVEQFIQSNKPLVVSDEKLSQLTNYEIFREWKGVNKILWLPK